MTIRGQSEKNAVRALMLCLCVVLPVLQGCVTETYIPPPYAGVRPESRLPLKAALYLKPYEGRPLAQATVDFHFNSYESDFIRILFGITTARAACSAVPLVFERVVEIRDPVVNSQIEAANAVDLFGEHMEARAPNLVERLALARQQQLDLLLEVEVTDYHHDSQEARISLNWTAYDVQASKQILSDQAQARAPNHVRVTPIQIRQAMMESQDLCRTVVHQCIEKMVQSIDSDLSRQNGLPTTRKEEP